MKTNTPKAVQDTHELALWIIPQIEKFPRVKRFTLGDRLEMRLFDLLEHLLQAAYSQGSIKQSALKSANLDITMLQHFWRLAFELNLISHRRYEYGAKSLDQIGSQVGGWLRQQVER